jgi:hypothetical protein
MRSVIALVLLCAWNLPAQTRVPAHSRNTEIRLEFSDTSPEDMLDVLVSSPKVKISLVLPDGSEVREEGVDPERLTWSRIDPADLATLLRKTPILLPGSGTHIIITFLTDHPTGAYKIRIDALQAAADSTIAVKRITAAEALMAVLRAMPGIRMTKSIPVQPRLKATSAHMTLPKGHQDDYLDVVVTDPLMKVRIILPDGHTIDASTAKGLGIEWKVGGLDQIEGDSIIGVPLLPIKATHILVAFGSFQRPAGSYTIEADSRAAKKRV